MANEVRFAVVGIHGFSRAHITELDKLEEEGAPARLVAVVAHQRERDGKFANMLEDRGIRMLPDFDAVLSGAGEWDVVTLPVGIPLHVPMATKVLAAGFPVYLEKPVAGTIQEVDELAVAQEKHGQPLFVGFQDGFQPGTWELKRRLCLGEWGKLKKIVAVTSWPRDPSYYARNNWAGRLRLDGTTVLDSPMNNACAHHLNLSLFLAGGSEAESARPVRIAAELYRAKPIESADTTAIRAGTEEGVEVVCVFTHSCEQHRGPRFRIECENGTIENDRSTGNKNPWRIRPREGAESTIPIGEHWADPLGNVARYVRGDRNVPVYTLRQARAHTLAVNGAHRASPIHDIPESFRREKTRDDGAPGLLFVPGMEAVVEACFERGCLPSESEAAPWAVEPRTAEVAGLTEFALP